MAGIEQLIVHSKSYVVRWVQVPELHSISWSVQPQKKSVEFGIVKHPGTKNGSVANLPTEYTDESSSQPPTPSSDGLPTAGRTPRQGSLSKNDGGTARDTLKGIGLKTVAWNGRCEPDKVSVGTYDVAEGEGGMYGCVFDNTFSKQTSKSINFVLMTHPTSAPPKSGHHLHYSQTPTGGAKTHSPSLGPVNDSSDSLPQVSGTSKNVLEDQRPVSKEGGAAELKGAEGTTFYTGVLHKRKRKKGQGYAKRFFSLNLTTSTLSYYRNHNASALRGAVPLELASVGVNEKTREFTIDSGAEVWHLKASSKDFPGWRDALERASKSVGLASSTSKEGMSTKSPSSKGDHVALEDREWNQVEQLVSKVAGSRDALRNLAKDTDPKYLPAANGAAGAASPTQESSNPYFPEVDERGDKRPFWKRKPSSERSPSALVRRSVSTQLAVPSPSAAQAPMSPPEGTPRRPSDAGPSGSAASEGGVHERCMSLLRDLDDVVADFAALIAQSKARRRSPVPNVAARKSTDSVDQQEFFDAEDGEDSSQLLNIQRADGEDEPDDRLMSQEESDDDSDADSDAGEEAAESTRFSTSTRRNETGLFPKKLEAIPPLPMDAVERRKTVTTPKQNPPSFIGFLRKNAGKDLSTVSMPVTANEPTSLLQRSAEAMEYASLIDKAASKDLSSEERLVYVTAFALSTFAYNRVKERALRKPFNPMLGETFELVREDLGFRFVAEKVTHHPIRMAYQADSLNNGGWSFTQSPRPIQKFWGKSVELNTEGRARLILHESGERYSWNLATCFLRNVIAGEKYVEPVQSMTVNCETTGMRAVATFKAGGVFSGRNEEVNVQMFEEGSSNSPMKIGISGKWTEKLTRTDNGDEVWSAGPLVQDAAKNYGFTTFAAALNEISEVEKDHIPPTDTRLRPDQQALEAGEYDKAESTKAKLEERQRSRRKKLEGEGKKWSPQFFELASEQGEGEGDEEVWRLKEKDGYWERREKGNWEGIESFFDFS